MIQGMDPERLRSIVQSTPSGRPGTPEEVANVILFLLFKESSYMVGQTIQVTSGQLMY